MQAKAGVYAAKKQAEEQKFANILRWDYEKKEIFKVAKQMIKTNQDVREKCVQDDTVVALQLSQIMRRKEPGNLTTNKY